LPAIDAAADYRVRIFSPDTEFPFAGHPTLGTAHALLESGMQTKSPGRIIQRCGIGLVTVEHDVGGALTFQAPPAKLQTLDADLHRLLAPALGSEALDWATPPMTADMGIKWLVVRMRSAAACLAARPTWHALAELTQGCAMDGVAIYGPHDSAAPCDYEVRALYVEHGMLVEDPVTGSANACIARILQAQDISNYSVRQGTLLQRDGRVSVRFREAAPWIGGHTVTVVDGMLLA